MRLDSGWEDSLRDKWQIAVCSTVCDLGAYESLPAIRVPRK